MATFFCKPPPSRPAGQGHRMGHEVRAKPQVHLTVMPGGHPVLDIEEKRHITSFSWPSHMWSRMTSIFSSPPPVQWVNQHLVTDTHGHPQPSLPQYTLMPPATFHDPVGGNLWHPAPPGGINQQMVMTDPQNMLSYSILPPKQDSKDVYPTCWKSTKTLNPYAQEWVPKEYRTTTTSTTTTATTTTAATTTTNSTNGYIEDKRSYLTPTIPYNSTATTTTTASKTPIQECRNTTNTTTATTTSSTNGYIEVKRPYLTPTTPNTTTTTPAPKTPVQEFISTSEAPVESPQYTHSPRNRSRMISESPKLTNCSASQINSGTTNQSHQYLVKSGSPKYTNDRMSLGSPKLTNCSASQTNSETMNQSHQNLLKSGSPKNTNDRMSPGSPTSPSQSQKLTTGSLGSTKNITVSLESSPKCQESQRNTLESKQNPGTLLSPKNTFKIKQMSPENLQPSPQARLSPEVDPSPSGATQNAPLPTKSHCQGSAILPSMALSPQARISQEADSTPSGITQNIPSPTKSQCQEGAILPSMALSYAGVLGRVSPPPPPPPDPQELKYKGVQQPLPKIFQGDRTLVKDDVVAVKEERGTCDLFRKLSKSHRTRARFLKGLKEARDSVCGSSNGDLSCSPSPGITATSPQIGSPDSSSSCDNTPSPCTSKMTPMTTAASTPIPIPASHNIPAHKPPSVTTPPIPIPATSSSPIAALSPAVESPNSRLSSESSVGSLDIEFVEQDEVDRAIQTVTPPQPRSIRNGFLACILGSGDSDTEEEEEEDSDWDDVSDDLNGDLDNSWETFGFGLVVSLPVPECQGSCELSNQEEANDTFQDINKRWNAEITKNVRGRSEPRVTFGGIKVHPMVVWGHAYRQARCGPWEQQARDRVRFRERVANLEPILSKILDPGHRRVVYQRLNGPKPCDCVL